MMTLRLEQRSRWRFRGCRRERRHPTTIRAAARVGALSGRRPQQPRPRRFSSDCHV